MSDGRNRAVALSLVMLVVGMVALSFAAVPLYRLFCQVTGFGGTTQAAQTVPDRQYDRALTVHFNSDIQPNLDWDFQPMQQNVTAHVGENMLVFFRAKNRSRERLTGTATFNVTPHKAGQHFVKVECFCFTEQTLDPGQEIEMPVSFYLDPGLLKDKAMNDVHALTLSYTFFPVRR